MPVELIALVLVHAAATLFWLLSSFVLARAAGKGAVGLFRWQMLAAVVAFLTGGRLWTLLHVGAFGPPEMMLAGGAACAFIATGVQGILVGGSIRRMKTGQLGETEGLRRITLGYRLSAGVLAVALLLMVGAPHSARPF